MPARTAARRIQARFTRIHTEADIAGCEQATRYRSVTDPISSANWASAVLSAQYQAKVIGLQKDAVDMAGKQALMLIQSASILPPDQGHYLDVRV